MNNIMSLIFGIVVGILVYRALFKQIIYKGPNSNLIRHKIYNVEGKCYKFNPVIHICPN